MDLKRIKSVIRNGRNKKLTIKQAADRLAPLEEQTQGLIIVGEDDFKPANDLIEKTDEVGWSSLLRFEAPVIVILLFALGFIVFIAWQISVMPPAAK